MKNILLVDDDDIFIFLNKSIIEDAGFTGKLDTCNSAKDALRFLSTCNNEDNMPDVILLDIKMPVMDGFEFLEELKKIPLAQEKVKVAMLTSSLSETDKRRSLGYKNVIDFINKPLSEHALTTLDEKLTQTFNAQL